MRDYGTVSPMFWIGETGKALRGDPAAQVLALYLMTGPHSTMTGVFHCPILYMAHESGLGIEGATKALQRLSEVGFCEYEEASEAIFVVRMAAYQIGESLKPNDNRILGLKRDLDRMPSAALRARFLEVYGVLFHLIDKATEEVKKVRGSKAPSKSLRSQEQEQGQEQDSSPPRFTEFWDSWPKTDRKQDRKKCLEKWKRLGLESQADVVIANVESLKRTKKWQDGFEPAPLTYLNGERWKDGPTLPAANSAFAGAV